MQLPDTLDSTQRKLEPKLTLRNFYVCRETQRVLDEAQALEKALVAKMLRRPAPRLEHYCALRFDDQRGKVRDLVVEGQLYMARTSECWRRLREDYENDAD